MIKKKFLSIVIFAFGFLMSSQSQPVNDTLAGTVQSINDRLHKLENLKISGYVQFQYQVAGSNGISSFAGGDFPSNSDNRFMVRRGRIKLSHKQGPASMVIQFDVTEKGLGIKDAYINLKEPLFNAFSFTGGVFNRPFGFEIGYSSSLRESPERARIIQSLFPKERDLGAMLTFQLPNSSPLSFLKLDAGLFAGNGTYPEFDDKKDFMGRLGASNSNTDKNIIYNVGASYYNGYVFQGTPEVYEMGSEGGISTFVPVADNKGEGAYIKRSYYGVDAQLSLKNALGSTILRGEYIAGEQPGSAISNESPSKSIPSGDTYIRNVNGAYFYFIQSIAGTNHSLLLKYDWYDPNTDIKGNNIGLDANGLATGPADLKYDTFGMGWIYGMKSKIRFTAYYEFVKNETSNHLTGFENDFKDNVLTLRMQYKF